MVVNLLIRIVNHLTAVYYPGQTVEACVELLLTERRQVKAIYAKFKGESRTSWSSGTGDNRKSHSESEQYFKTEIPLFQAADSDHGETSVGTYEYPVDFKLPVYIPSSFEGKSGSVRYLLKAKVKIKGGAVYRAQYPFTVISQLDLNGIRGARLPIEMQDTKTGCCLCCETGPVTCMIHLDKKGYVPGEKIKINAEVTNNGTSSIQTTTVDLVMTTKYRAYGSSTNDYKVIASISHGAVGPGQSDVWNGDQLLVPSTPPSLLFGCSIIDIQYLCRLVADIDGSMMNIIFDLPVVIGTIILRDESPQVQNGQWSEPYRESGDNFSLNNMANAGPITSQPKQYSDAPPSYEECMTTDRVRIMKQNSNSADQEEEFTNFSPSYPYYKTYPTSSL